MLSPKVRRNILRIIPFGVMWLVFSIVYVMLERALLGGLDYYPTTGNPYIFIRNLFTVPLLALLIGVLIGVLEIIYFSKWFLHKSFTKKIVYKSFIYLWIILFFLIVTFITTANGMPAAIFQKDFWLVAWTFFTDYSFLGVLIYLTSIILMTQFYTEVSESLGTGLLRNFFLGKYYKPVEEERIFMFLDMKSSTEIAGKLGHVKYFEMLKDYFSDLSDPVIEYSGEIYQYAGDEIIVSWTLKNGLKNNNCIRCFFAMKESIQKQTGKYDGKFGLSPQFKAGLHYGKVTTGEIGVLKKEIIFTGDVLNTTARIEGLCNQFDVDILVSDALVEKLDLSPYFLVQSIGESTLRGRDEKIGLFTLGVIA